MTRIEMLRARISEVNAEIQYAEQRRQQYTMELEQLEEEARRG